MSELDDFEGMFHHRGFQSIEDMVDALDAAGYWKPAWLDKTSRRAKKAKIRALIRQSKDASGWPTWASIILKRADGTEQRVYKQETLFDMDDYDHVINYWKWYVQHGMKMAEGYRDRKVKRGGEQLTLPWEEGDTV